MPRHKFSRAEKTKIREDFDLELRAVTRRWKEIRSTGFGRVHILYNHKTPTVLVEFKPDTVDLETCHKSGAFQALSKLCDDRNEPIPFFVVKASLPDSRFQAIPVNKSAIKYLHLPKIFDEKDFVFFLRNVQCGVCVASLERKA